MNLGQKQYNSNSLGVKTHGKNSMGVKFNNGTSSGISSQVLAHTSDGIIRNYSNSSDAHKEPIKGVQVNTRKLSNLQIEKPKKKDSQYA